jgi:hypothetical protein
MRLKGSDKMSELEAIEAKENRTVVCSRRKYSPGWNKFVILDVICGDALVTTNLDETDVRRTTRKAIATLEVWK